MTLIDTIVNSDPYSLIAYAGLGLCLLWLLAQCVALVRFRARLGTHSLCLAEALRGGSTAGGTLPRYLADPVSQLQTDAAPERLLELRMLLKNRINRSGTTARLIAPAFGIAGTMSGAWTFLAEFDRSSLGGQPSMQGLSDATATTWIGLMLMVAAILVTNRMGALADDLLQKTAQSLRSSQPPPNHRTAFAAPKPGPRLPAWLEPASPPEPSASPRTRQA